MKKVKADKLQLVYMREGWMSCIKHPHYDLCTVEESPKNIACILAGGKYSNNIVKKMVKLYNDSIREITKEKRGK